MQTDIKSSKHIRRLYMSLFFYVDQRPWINLLFTEYLVEKTFEKV